MLGNVAEHVFATLDVFIEKIGGELRIKNAGRAHGEKHQEQDRNDGDEQAGNDEAVAEAPKQAISSPGQEAVEEIKGSEKGNKL
jgi:hypothetical protein